MPLKIPTLDDRSYQQLVDDALARIPIHNPEWTNFNDSDPGVTLIQVFSFLTENLLYRSNQIPERNRKKFLSLLGIPLRAASSARGVVTFTNERGPLQTITLNDGIHVQAGQVPFRTTAGLDLLPVQARVFFKRKIDATAEEKAYYSQLYTSFKTDPLGGDEFNLYETTPLTPRGQVGVDLGTATIDHSLWIALLVRTTDKPYAETVADARQAIKGKTISLGLAPYVDDAGRRLAPGGQANANSRALLQFQIPKIPSSGLLPDDPSKRNADYQTLATSEIPVEPAVVQVQLPDDVQQLTLWSNLDPLEPGTLDFPPALDDTLLGDRVITWLRILAPAGFQVLWADINATFVEQRDHVANQVLPAGTGEPDQVVVLSKTPVIPNSAQLTVIPPNSPAETWQEIDDLLAAGPEVPTRDSRLPPGYPTPINTLLDVFTLDSESGTIRFGDGTRGRRPPLNSIMRVSYDYGVGRAGNVGAGAINSGSALPSGIKVNNPLPTWGGTEAETESDGEKQIARYLQHRDRLVNASDFETIARRAPGVDLGRIDVIPAYNPDLENAEPGDAPGAVTLMVIPKYDPAHPDTPEPDSTFLNALCDYLDSRRLVTTEVFLRSPRYVKLWISIGINVIGGASLSPTRDTLTIPQVREAVKQALLDYLSPLPSADGNGSSPTDALASPSFAETQKGWPRLKAVTDRELIAAASRVPGVLSIAAIQLIDENSTVALAEIPMVGLQLPRVAGIVVGVGTTVDVLQVRGQRVPSDLTAPPGPGPTTPFKPMPVIPDECR